MRKALIGPSGVQFGLQTRKVVFDATTLSMNCKQVVFVDQNSCIKDEIERERSSKSQVNPEVSSGYFESFRNVTGLLSYKPDSRVVNGLSIFLLTTKTIFDVACV